MSKAKTTFIYRTLISVLVFFLVFAPFTSFALTGTGSGLVPCSNTPGPAPDYIISDPCDFNAFMELINNLIKYVIILAIPLAAISFAYAGFLLVTAGGESAHAFGEAKGIFTNTLVGLVIILAAWLIIKTILSILGYDAGWIFDNFNQ